MGSLFILDLLILVAILLSIIINLFLAHSTDINNTLLSSFPFLIIVTDKEFHVKYYNNTNTEVTRIFPIDYDENSSFCYVTLNNESKPIGCYIFNTETEIYFLSKENKKADITSILTLMSITDDTYKYFNNEVQIVTILEYAGKLLNADCVCYYTREKDILVEEEFWCNTGTNTNNDKVIKMLDLDYSQPYFYLTIDKLSKERQKVWKENGIQCKLIVPIHYENEIEKQVTANFYLIPPSPAIVSLVVGILNFIIKLKIKYEKEYDRKLQLESINEALIKYLNIEKGRFNVTEARANHELKLMNELTTHNTDLDKIIEKMRVK